MNYTKCNHCEKTSIPINKSLKIDGKVFCESCLETNFPDESSFEGKNIEKDLDPTVCAYCEKDNGVVPFPKLAHYPICENCDADLKKRTFPAWVKAFFAFILLVVIFSFLWNWKYYQAYNDLNKAMEISQTGNFEEATKLLESVTDKVPEVEDLHTLKTYYNGLNTLFNKLFGI